MVHSQKAEILYYFNLGGKKGWLEQFTHTVYFYFVSFYDFVVIDVSLLGGAKAKPSQGTNVNCCFLPLNELNGV